MNIDIKFKNLKQLRLKNNLLTKKIDRDFFKLMRSCKYKTIYFGGGEWIACTHKDNKLRELNRQRVPCCLGHCPRMK